eukprot:9026862-Pyramimonas_sp.AAC.1
MRCRACRAPTTTPATGAWRLYRDAPVQTSVQHLGGPLAWLNHALVRNQGCPCRTFHSACNLR